MIKTKQPITSINGFNIGDKVRLKDGDGREHIIKSFSIEGLDEFFFEVQFEDGSWTVLDNIELLPSNLDGAAIDFADNARKQLYSKDYAIASIADYDHGCIDGFKAGAEWMARQMKQEQVDLEEAMQVEYYKYATYESGSISGEGYQLEAQGHYECNLTRKEFKDIARHFYELGLNARKED